jgi:hypothetical protein
MLSSSHLAVASLAFITLVEAAQHGLIVGNFVQGSLYSVTFDDKTLKLELAANTTVPAPSSWLSWSVRPTVFLASLLKLMSSQA